MSYKVKQSSTAYPLVFMLVQSADHITGLTAATPTVTISKAGAAFASPAGAVTEVGNGWYKVAGNATDSATLGPLVLHATAASADPSDMLYEVVAIDVQDGVRYGLTGLANAVPGAAGGLFIAGTNAATSVSITGNITGNLSGSVGSVTTVSDKTGYSLTQAFPTNFSSMALTVGGAVTVGTNGDKTGYSLSQTFPANFSAMSITVGGAVTAASVTGSVGSVTGGVTVTTNNDKTGYALTQAFPANFASTAISVGGAVTVGTNSDKTGYALTQAFPANFSALAVTVGGAVTAGTVSDKAGYSISGTKTTLDALNDITAASVWTSTLTESYAANHSAFTGAQAMYQLWAAVSQFSIAGTTITAQKIDGTTTAMTYTISDATNPTSRVRAT